MTRATRRSINSCAIGTLSLFVLAFAPACGRENTPPAAAATAENGPPTLTAAAAGGGAAQPQPQPRPGLAEARATGMRVGATVKAPIVVSSPERLTWVDQPPMLPPGGKMAIIEGDPAAPNALFTIRAKLPPNYKIMPHRHPTDEHVTVLSGSFLVGHGDTFARDEMTELPAGGYAVLPAGHHHFATTGTRETILQIHAVGPLDFTYVNPADDPRNQPKK